MENIDKTTHLYKIGKKNPFTVPQNYFETLSENIMCAVDNSSISCKKNTKRGRVGHLYMWFSVAAIAIGALFLINKFILSPFSTKIDPYKYSKGLNLSDSKDIDAFYSYYKDQELDEVYEDEIYNMKTENSNNNN